LLVLLRFACNLSCTLIKGCDGSGNVLKYHR